VNGREHYGNIAKDLTNAQTVHNLKLPVTFEQITQQNILS